MFSLRSKETGGAWLSSARVVRCWVKSRNERNPYGQLLRKRTLARLPLTKRRKVGMTSNHHALYDLGYTRTTMALNKEKQDREVEQNSETTSQFGLQAATRLHEVGIASNRGSSLVSCFVCAFFSCALELFICRICHGKQACMITTFAVSLLVMYASGCLIPSAFLPDMLRRISATLPGSQLKNMIFWQFGQSVSSFDIIILIIEGILLIIAALLAGTFKKGKLTHSLRERSKYEEK